MVKKIKKRWNDNDDDNYDDDDDYTVSQKNCASVIL